MAKRLTVDRVLSRTQLKTLLREAAREKDAAVASGMSSKFILDYYVFAIAAATGLRISEMAALVWRDIDVEGSFLIVRSGKGGLKRDVLFGSRTQKLFMEYREIYRQYVGSPDSERRLFIGRRGPLTSSGLHQRFLHWRLRMGLPKGITFHSFRHSALTFLLDSGVPLQTVRDFAGHANISTTSRYLWMTEEAKSKLRAVL